MWKYLRKSVGVILVTAFKAWMADSGILWCNNPSAAIDARLALELFRPISLSRLCLMPRMQYVMDSAGPPSKEA